MKARVIVACLLAGLSLPLLAQDRQQVRATERPEVLNRLTACRAITADADRLACFDQQVAALEAAEAAREIAVVDRQQIRQTRRSLFGLALPDLGIFGDDEDASEDGAAVNEINSTIRSTYTGADDRFHYTLADNSVWVQTEARRGQPPRAGQSIRIRRGTLGSFVATVEGRTGVRVARVR